nr:unnamed protein product [Spirometra erinaceieuropaei]
MPLQPCEKVVSQKLNSLSSMEKEAADELQCGLYGTTTTGGTPRRGVDQEVWRNVEVQARPYHSSAPSSVPGLLDSVLTSGPGSTAIHCVKGLRQDEESGEEVGFHFPTSLLQLADCKAQAWCFAMY